MLVAGLAALAVGLALGLPNLLSGDHDEHGRIAIPPGRGVVDLPAGEVVVFYEEARAISTDQAVPEPQVDWEIRPDRRRRAAAARRRRRARVERARAARVDRLRDARRARGRAPTGS